MNISVHEEFDYREDLLPTKSPFAFRLAPTVDGLSWRYNMRLSFVRYRLFRILAGERSAGYVIIDDGRERVLIAQGDADNPITFARSLAGALEGWRSRAAAARAETDEFDRRDVGDLLPLWLRPMEALDRGYG